MSSSPAPTSGLSTSRISLLPLFDYQIAEAIDDAGLAREQQRGGVELGEDGGAVDAGAGAERVTGVDGGLGGALSRNTVCAPTRAASIGPAGGSSRSVGAGNTPRASTRSVTISTGVSSCAKV